MKIVVMIQARLGSTRLPGKVGMPLIGLPMLSHQIQRAARATQVWKVVVLCPAKDAVVLSHITMPLGVDLYADPGDEADLVGRHVRAAAWSQADLIVRVPGDNPCVDPAYLDAAIETYLTDPYLYYSNTTADAGGMMLDGIGGEVLSRSRLEWLDQKTKGCPEWREHPHRYFEECGLIRLPKTDIRLDVNTQEDFEFIQTIYDHFGHNKFTSEEVAGYLSVSEEKNGHGRRTPLSSSPLLVPTLSGQIGTASASAPIILSKEKIVNVANCHSQPIRSRTISNVKTITVAKRHTS